MFFLVVLCRPADSSRQLAVSTNQRGCTPVRLQGLGGWQAVRQQYAQRCQNRASTGMCVFAGVSVCTDGLCLAVSVYCICVCVQWGEGILMWAEHGLFVCASCFFTFSPPSYLCLSLFFFLLFPTFPFTLILFLCCYV